jgi:hypothetical protein
MTFIIQMFRCRLEKNEWDFARDYKMNGSLVVSLPKLLPYLAKCSNADPKTLFLGAYR